MTPEQATALRKPFDPKTIGKLPKGGAQLDFVGHAAVTDRLLAVDPAWTWEPLAVDDNGLPAYQNGALWIRLTVCGVTRIGVGDGPDPKQRIGDAIRNAAMRFGVALDLWSKQELEGTDPNGGDSAAPAHHNGTVRPPAAASAPPPDSHAPEEPVPPGPADGLPSPEANVEQLRARVIDVMSLPRRAATIQFAKLKAEIAKAGVASVMTTTPGGSACTLGALCDQALDFVTQKHQGNPHADVAAGEQIEVPA